MVDQPWTLMSMNCFGPYTHNKAGNCFVFLLHEYFTKCIECKALQAANAKNVGAALEDILILR